MTAAAVETKPRVVLIDLSSLYHPAWRASENQPLSVAFQATLDAVTKCAKRDPNALVAICLDSRKSWRKELAPTYKAQREKLGNDFYATLDRVKERLRADGYLLLESEGFEADDIIATMTEEAVARGHDVGICSADKDLMQLLRPGVVQIRTHDWSRWTEAEVKAKYGVLTSQFCDYLALVGDTADNVDSAHGVGPVNAADALTQWGTLEALGVALEKDIGACGRNKPKRKDDPGEPRAWAKSINDNWDKVIAARKLVSLRTDVPISFETIYQERAVKPLIATEEPPVEETHPAVAAAEKVFGVKAQTIEAQSDTVAIGELVDLPKPMPANETKALAPVSNPNLQPNSVEAAWWLAKTMFNSRLYTKFGNAEAVLATMIRGKEMGFPVLTSLDLFDVIQGRPALKAVTIQANAERLPDCTYLRMVSSTSTGSTWETKHAKHSEPTTHTYSIEDAVAAGLTATDIVAPPPAGKEDKRGQWDKRRKEMLRKTAMVQLVRMVYPSATLGLYAREELTDREED